METVTLSLQGQRISLEKFARAVEQFSLLMNELSREADATDLQWEVDELRVSSATTIARATSENGINRDRIDHVIRSYSAVGRGLQTGTATQFAPKIRKPVEALTALIAGEVTGILFETPEDDVIVTDAPQAVPSTETPRLVTASGGVTGRIQTLSSRSHLHFTLYDRLHDRAVSCYLDEGEEERLRPTWDKIATVQGLVTRDREHGWPVSVRQVAGIHLLNEGEAQDYRRAKGAIPYDPDAPPPEERIRRLRDAG
jgi:hypothetical protein